MSTHEELIQGFRLSPQQEHLWRLQQGGPSQPYRAQCAVMIEGGLDVQSLDAALRLALARNEILRTAFRSLPGMSLPLQVISDSPVCFIKEHDLTRFTAEQQQALIDDLFQEAALKRFDLEQAPLLDSSLIILSPELHVLLLCLPALCADAAGLSNLTREIADCYAATTKATHALREPVQYADLSEWQNELLESEETEPGRRYWREQIAGGQLDQPLPFEIASEAGGEFQPQSHSRILSIGSLTEIKELAARFNTTPELLLLSCWQLLLERLTGATHLIVGALSDGRQEQELKEAQGLFFRYLPVTCRFDDRSRFDDLLNQVIKAVSEGRKYQEAFSWEDLHGQIADARQPLFFAYCYDFERAPEKYFTAGLSFSIIKQHVCTDRFKVKLSCLEWADSLLLEFHYDSLIVSTDQAGRLAGELIALIKSLSARPDAALGELDILDEVERDQILVSFNATHSEYRLDVPIHRLIALQAERVPQSTALICGGERMSYAELNRRSNQLANYLAQTGVVGETRVAICVDRSFEMVVAILGTLKAGGAYVPLDASYPKKRLAFMLEDAQAPVLLTTERLATALPRLPGLIKMDSDWEAIAAQPETDPQTEILPENLAYIIYTSGSTGTPKGVMVTHGGLLNYLNWCTGHYEAAQGCGTPVHSPLGFDLTVTSLFPSLIAGRSITLLAADNGIDALGESLRAADNFSLVKITPAHLQLLTQSVNTSEAAVRTRAFIIGGEALRAEDLSYWREHAPEVRLINEYGPTETVVGCCVYEVGQSDPWTGAVAVGRPIANTEIYLLNAQMTPVPLGVVGEIYIGGHGLARGYLNRPDLTSERFVPNPFSADAGARLYRTGDLGRILPECNLEFLGRIDDQVKLRGYRIELGEIAAALKEHPAIRESAVEIREYGPDDRRLVAYVVSDPVRAFTVQQVLQFEREGKLARNHKFELPNGMVVAGNNRGETDYLYKEIFEEQIYWRDAITLAEGDCVVDVGANIGFFTLYVGQKWPKVRIYAFEPIGPTFDLLAVNTSLYGLDVKLFNCGLADAEKTETFTYYPHLSVMSGRFADQAEEKEVVRYFEANKTTASAAETPGWNDILLDEVLEDRLSRELVTCHLRRLSDVIREQAIERIDLLKIDAEKSEMDVLAGIDPPDWQKIRQVLIEVHDIEGRVERVTGLLEGHGFNLDIRQESFLKDTALYVVCGVRAEVPPIKTRPLRSEAASLGQSFYSPRHLVNDVRSFLQDRLPEYMVPAAIVLLEQMPLTANGKLNYAALPGPDSEKTQLDFSFIGPRTPIEEMLVGIWKEVLRLDSVGVRDNFFALGGHSLLLTQVISRIRKQLQVDVAIREMFEHPTIEALAGKIEASATGNGSKATAIKRTKRSGELPLSFAQQRLWFLQQLDPQSAAYNIPVAVRFQGALNLEALADCFNELVRRHEVLRTRIETMSGAPSQTIGMAQSMRLSLVDLSDQPETECLKLASRIANEEAAVPFNLSRGPLLRIKLLRLNQDDHVLLVIMHHIISDGWSMGVLIAEIATLYEAFIENKESPLKELAIQYVDYAAWQRELLEGEVLEEHLKYWRSQLEGVEPLELPADRPRPSVQNYRGSSRAFMLPERLSVDLDALSRSEGVTLFMLLLAAFNVLLYRYSGQPDITVGTPIANRNRVEVERLIGFFVNMLVLRTTLSGDSTFRHYLRQVRDVTIGAYAHQDLPFEKLVEAIQPERDMSHSPLFQVLFALQNAPTQKLELSGLRISPFHAFESTTSKFDLSLMMVSTPKGLRGSLEFNEDLFTASTIDRMVGHFEILLGSIAANPEQQVARLPLMDQQEYSQIVEEWNQTVRDYPRQRCIHELFEQQATRQPARTALVFDRQRLSYGQLNERANQLAHHLIGLGVEAESLVGICLERSVEMVVGLLAILKAGGAYVPIDPNYPGERIAYMMSDAGLAVLVTQASLRGQLPATAARVVELEGEAAAISEQERGNPGRRAAADNLAYVIYTSGSTGQPKGVQIAHRAVVNFLTTMAEAPGLDASDRLLAVTTLSFDIAGLELWLPLIRGAEVVVASREQAGDGQQLIELIKQTGATVMQATPSSWRMMRESGWSGGGEMKVLCGGEELSRELGRELEGSGGEVWNLYGPTETTIWSTKWRVEGAGEGVKIGRPIANTEVYILDERMEAVAVGVSGELYLGGEGLARGYLNKAEQTAERFVPNPYSREAGGRLYRTGDLCRYKADGEIEYQGRLDQQVKVRGYRIELGEIEAVLMGHGQVREAVVVAVEESGGGKRLVAYVVAEPAGNETGKGAGNGVGNETGNESSDGASEVGRLGRELREYVKGKLPGYMVPSVVMEMGELPRTPNGKLDRRRLPAAAAAGASAEEGYEAASTAVEEVLVEIWQELLGVRRVGVRDNFFALGGHSLLATRLISRIEEAFQIPLSLRTLFERPSIFLLSQNIDLALRSGYSLEIKPITRAERAERMPVSYAQQRVWFIEQLEPGSAAYNIPAAVHLQGRLDLNALQSSLDRLVARHEILRTRFVAVDGEPVQVISAGGEAQLRVIDLTSVEGEARQRELRRLLDEEASQGFELSRGELLRVRVVQLSREEQVLQMTMHHIVSDGWSMGVMIGEVSREYEREVEGRGEAAGELAVQYADYAVWQRQWLQGDLLANQLSYWKTQLDGIETLELPTDHIRPAMKTYRGAAENFRLSGELSEKLKTLSRKQNATMYMVLLGAFKVLLYRYSGQADIAVGTPVAGRNRVEIEPLIGFFVNTLVLRTQVAGRASFTELLAALKQVCLSGWAHQEIPFEKLVEHLQPQRDLSRSPLFQVMFALQNAADERLSLPGLTMRSVNLEGRTAKFDLTLTMGESAAGLTATLEYNADLYEGATIQRMSGHLANLLAAISEAPEQAVGDLRLMSAGEREQVLVGWNQTARDYPRQGCIHELFEQQAARQPARTAIVFERQRLSYGQLNERANQLAHHLISLGVEAESLVGICLERSVEMVVGLLAILKAGGAYVPIDPNYPGERIAYMMSDAGLAVLVTQASLRGQLPATAARVVELEGEAAAISAQERANPGRRAAADNLAYVIYTSGSTGQPKGVCVSHRAVSRLVINNSFAELSPAHTLLQFAPVAFDASTFEIWGALLNGARLVIAPAAVASLLELAETIKTHQVTTAWLTAGLFHLFVEERLHDLAPLTQVLAGGDVLSARHVQRVLDEMAGLRVINGYGPTEATTFSCCQTMESGSRVGGSVLIGGPIGNTRVYVLDEQQGVVPEGVEGELYIAGEGLARGYLNGGGETAEKFVPNLYGEKGGERMYRSGDRVRWRSGGKLEFRGRQDRQVKVRGYRVELGEVEKRLGEEAGVREAVVEVRGEGEEKRLVGYVVWKEGEGRRVGELREGLKKKVPEYMVPSVVVEVEELPLTENGKVDRAALPDPDPRGWQSEKEYVAPQTAIEKELAKLSSRVLKVDRVGLYDNFFELGGHSLLAVQLLSRIRRLYGAELSLKDLLTSATLKEIADKIEAAILSSAQLSNIDEMLDLLDAVDDEQVERMLASDNLRLNEPPGLED